MSRTWKRKRMKMDLRQYTAIVNTLLRPNHNPQLVDVIRMYCRDMEARIISGVDEV
jgi:hypothetical protein